MTKIAIGATVSVDGLAFSNGGARNGTVVGQALHTNNLLIDLGPGFKGHGGNGVRLTRGQAADNQNQWFVYPDYVTEIVPVAAPVAKAPQAGRQQCRILNHLLAGNSITQLEAFGVYGIFRLAARVHELKSRGHKIVTNMKADANGKPYAEYSLVTARRA